MEICRKLSALDPFRLYLFYALGYPTELKKRHINVLVRCSYILIVFCSVFPITTAGQGLVMEPFPPEKATIIFHYQAVDFSRYPDYQFPSGSLEIAGIVPLNSKLFLLGKIPIGNYFGRHSNDTTTWSTSGVVLGSISLGFGIFLAWRNRREPEPSQRFRLMRRLFGGRPGQTEVRKDPTDDF